MAVKDYKKRRGRRAQYLRVSVGMSAMLALALVAFGTAHAAWDMYGKFADAAAADAAGQQELAQLKAQYDSVSTEVADLNTTRGMGAAIRERYGVGLPGEGEIDVIRQSTSSAAVASAPHGFFAGLWDALFGW